MKSTVTYACAILIIAIINLLVCILCCVELSAAVITLVGAAVIGVIYLGMIILRLSRNMDMYYNLYQIYKGNMDMYYNLYQIYKGNINEDE